MIFLFSGKKILITCIISENDYFCSKHESVDMPRKKQDASDVLTKEIVKGIQEKKGKDIISLDLKKIPNAICDVFVICTGTSSTQVEAIADSVEDVVRKSLGDKPWHKEGFENAEWILLDYVNVVVHIFQDQARMFYNLEKLWDDATVKKYLGDK
jgi:ribosome-associated protein